MLGSSGKLGQGRTHSFVAPAPKFAQKTYSNNQPLKVNTQTYYANNRYKNTNLESKVNNNYYQNRFHKFYPGKFNSSKELRNRFQNNYFNFRKNRDLQQNANSHNFKRAQNFRHFRTNSYRSYNRNLDPNFDPIEDEKRCAKAYKNYQFANSQTNKFRHHFNSNPFVVNSFDDKKNNVKNLKIAENKPFNVSSDKIRGNFITSSSAKLSNHTLQKSSPIIFNQSKKFKLTKNSPSVSNFIGAQAFEQKNPKPILIGEGEDYNESKYSSSKAKNYSASAAIANVAPIAPKVQSQKITKKGMERKEKGQTSKTNGIEVKNEIDFDSITILNSEIVTIPHEIPQKNIANKAQSLSNTPVEKNCVAKKISI